jgi:hypothetical protein
MRLMCRAKNIKRYPSNRDRTSDLEMSSNISNYSLTLFQLSYRGDDYGRVQAMITGAHTGRLNPDDER